MESSGSLVIREYDQDRKLLEDFSSDWTADFRIYQPSETAVVLGRGSKPEIELNYTACYNDGIPIYQRRGGGCSVVIDPGNLIVSVVLPTEGIAGNRKYFNRLTGWLISGLNRIGIEDIYQDGISDIVQNNRKVGGASIHRTMKYLYYSTTLLIDPDVDLMKKYLNHPPREPDYRAGRKHEDFVGKLRFSSGKKTPLQVMQELHDSVNSLTNVFPSE